MRASIARIRSILTMSFISAALVVPALAGAVEPGPEGSTCRPEPFRPNQPPPDTRPSYVMPRLQRPTAVITTWAVQTQRRNYGGWSRGADPYKAELAGYNENSKVTIKAQQPSANLVLPTGCPQPSSATKSKLSPERQARRAKSRQWQAAVSQALQMQELLTHRTSQPSARQTNVVERPELLATHTPVVVEARDQFNRRYARVVTNVKGLPVYSDGFSQNGYYYDRQTGGTVVPAYASWANTSNVFITPAYDRNGSQQVKLLGLAAFPIGAKVSVTNTRLEGEGAANHTVTVDRTSKSGTAALALPGLQGDKLRVRVSFDPVANQAAGSEYIFYTRVPKASGEPAIKARGIRYYPVTIEQ
jgi:hypothetical protein